MKGIAPLSIVLETIILTIKLHQIRMIGLEPIIFDTQSQCSTIKLHSGRVN
jgi:hypothetical protein